MRPLQAHCQLGLGTLYATTGQPEQARAELSAAINLYRVMEMTFWLPQAEGALAQAVGAGGPVGSLGGERDGTSQAPIAACPTIRPSTSPAGNRANHWSCGRR